MGVASVSQYGEKEGFVVGRFYFLFFFGFGFLFLLFYYCFFILI